MGRLLAGSQAFDHMVKQANRAVGAGQADFPSTYSPRFLFRHVPGEALNIVLGGHAVEQCKSRIPGFRDHPIRALVRRQIVGEAYQAIAALGTVRRIDGCSHPLLVDVEQRAIEGPALALDPTQQRAHERETALVKRAQPGEAHDRLG